MINEHYRKLVDLYAGRDLPAELEEDMEVAAVDDLDLNRDMMSLRNTVDALRSGSGPEYTEESYQRILMKLYTRGAAIQSNAPDPAHLQYHLPMQA